MKRSLCLLCFGMFACEGAMALERGLFVPTQTGEMQYQALDLGFHSLANPVSIANGVQIEAQQGASSATLKLSKTIANFAWSGLVQTPVSKTDTFTTLGTLDGLTSNTTIELRMSNITGVVLSGSHLFWGVSGKGGFTDYTFYDNPSLTKHKERRNGWSAGAYAAVRPDGSNFMFVVSGRAQDTYKDADSKTLCPPPSGSTSVITCVSGPIGEPARKRSNVFSIEGRAKLPGLRISEQPQDFIGVSLIASRDTRNKITGVQLPIYLVGDIKGLNGGIRMDWTSETKTTVGIFIGTTFEWPEKLLLQ